ncbi:hypothetical protein WJX72_012408 [[Myrmecia] bisecta]|uniref:Chromo domain-containing protein n=1 Tax=[Myrmecia] bisecta TaxID=41462 RepID=A0AAW1PA52_9CHLO
MRLKGRPASRTTSASWRLWRSPNWQATCRKAVNQLRGLPQRQPKPAPSSAERRRSGRERAPVKYTYEPPVELERPKRSEVQGKAKALSSRSARKALSVWNGTYYSSEARDAAAAAALTYAAACENDALAKVLAPSNCQRGYWMQAPTSFNTLLPYTEQTKIYFQCEEPARRTWRYTVSASDSRWQIEWMPGRNGFSGGWRGFAIDQELTPNDTCVFELLPAASAGQLPADIMVHVFRAENYETNAAAGEEPAADAANVGADADAGAAAGPAEPAAQHAGRKRAAPQPDAARKKPTAVAGSGGGATNKATAKATAKAVAGKAVKAKAPRMAAVAALHANPAAGGTARLSRGARIASGMAAKAKALKRSAAGAARKLHGSRAGRRRAESADAAPAAAAEHAEASAAGGASAGGSGAADMEAEAMEQLAAAVAAQEAPASDAEGDCQGDTGDQGGWQDEPALDDAADFMDAPEANMGGEDCADAQEAPRGDGAAVGTGCDDGCADTPSAAQHGAARDSLARDSAGSGSDANDENEAGAANQAGAGPGAAAAAKRRSAQKAVPLANAAKAAKPAKAQPKKPRPQPAAVRAAPAASDPEEQPYEMEDSMAGVEAWLASRADQAKRTPGLAVLRQHGRFNGAAPAAKAAKGGAKRKRPAKPTAKDGGKGKGAGAAAGKAKSGAAAKRPKTAAAAGGKQAGVGQKQTVSKPAGASKQAAAGRQTGAGAKQAPSKPAARKPAATGKQAAASGSGSGKGKGLKKEAKADRKGKKPVVAAVPEEEDGGFTVDYILEFRPGLEDSKGEAKFLIRWLGYGPKWDTWEPASCMDQAPESYDWWTPAHKEAYLATLPSCSK